ncbi:MAG: LapA family protein [Thermodesulfobacteriota bacterium]|nr:LapA family protein [Thermodesulfobacteriota bacterium]
MKKIKIGLWLIVVGLIALVIYQNREFIFIQHHFGVNLFVTSYQTPELPNIVILVIFFVVGFLAAYIPGLAARFRSNKTIKALNKQVSASNEKISALEREINVLKQPVTAPTPPAPEPVEPASAVEETVEDPATATETGADSK